MKIFFIFVVLVSSFVCQSNEYFNIPPESCGIFPLGTIHKHATIGGLFNLGMTKRERKKIQDKKYRETHREEIKIYCKNYRDTHKEETKKYRKNYKKIHKKEISIKGKIYYQKIKHTRKKYNEQHIEERKLYDKNRYESNKEKIKNQVKDYAKKNIKKIRVYANSYNKTRRQKDISFRLKHNMGAMVRRSALKNKYDKKSKTYEIIGMTSSELKIYIEGKFESWMNWNNYGLYNGDTQHGWDIDHIIPLSSANTEEEILRLYHYTNLQPLCSYTNRYIKKNKKQWKNQ